MPTSIENVPFHWDKQRQQKDFPLWEQSTFLEFCSRLAAEQNSPLQYALQWKYMSNEQRDALAFGCENGDWNTMRRCFLLAAKVITHRFGTFPLSGDKVSYWKFDLPFTVKSPAEAQLWLSRWRVALCLIFRPAFWNDEPFCVETWRDWKDTNCCLVECAPPTHHEALEAQLELREFLRPHLPADEIEALFTP